MQRLKLPPVGQPVHGQQAQYGAGAAGTALVPVQDAGVRFSGEALNVFHGEVKAAGSIVQGAFYLSLAAAGFALGHWVWSIVSVVIL